MPAMSGLRLAQELRQTRPDIPIVFASGYLPPEEQAKAQSLGIRQVVTKPVNTRELLNVPGSHFSGTFGFLPSGNGVSSLWALSPQDHLASR